MAGYLTPSSWTLMATRPSAIGSPWPEHRDDPTKWLDLTRAALLTRRVTRDAAAHDGAFHAPSDDPDWAESSCFSVSIPERDINGFIYYFHDARCGITGGGPALWDPSGEQPYDCLFYDWRWRQPPTGPIDFDDFTLPNGLRHRVTEPSRRYWLEYAQLGLDFDLEWTALMPPHQLGPVDDAAGHFDHPGRLTGTLTPDGERFESIATQYVTGRGAHTDRAHHGPATISGRSHRPT